MEIRLLDGRKMELRTWFRNIFIDATSFDFKEIRENIILTVGIRNLTLSTLNTIIETLKLNNLELKRHNVQIRPKNSDSFIFWLLIEKSILSKGERKL